MARPCARVLIATALAIQFAGSSAHAFEQTPDVDPELQIFAPTAVETEVVSKKRIADLPAQDVADVAKTMTGVRTQTRIQGQEAAAAVEGMPAEYTKLLVDGAHYSGEIGGVADLADVPVKNVEEIRLIRGPQAVRYGSDAGGAVLEVETIRPPASDGFGFNFEGGAGSDRAGYAAQSTAARYGALGATLAATYRTIGGQADRGTDSVFVGSGEDSQESWEDLYGTLTYRLTETSELRTNLGWRGDNDRYRSDPFASSDPNLPPDSGTEGRRDISRWLGGMGWKTDLGDMFVLDSEFSGYASDFDSSVGRPVTIDESEWKFSTALTATPEWFGFEPRFTLGVDRRLPNLKASEEVFFFDDEPVAATGGSIDKSLSTTGIFGIAEIDANSWSTIELGVREQMNSKFASRLVPQAALLLKPHPLVRLRFSWGESYRTPTLRDLYQPPVAQVGGAYFLAGNSDLEPESAVGWRAGFEANPLPWMALSGTYFDNRIHDYIRSVEQPGGIVVGTTPSPPSLPPTSRPCQSPTPPPQCFQGPDLPVTRPLFRKENLDDVATHGVEAQLRIRPNDRIDLRAGYYFIETYVKSVNLIGLRELPNEPHTTFDLSGVFTLPEWETRLTVRGRWRSSALTEGSGTGLFSFASNERSDPSWIVDMRIVQPLFSNLDAYLDIDNMTNENIVDSYEVRQTTYFLGMRWNFDRSTP